MNLRNYSGDYDIGLDMGPGSVGWAVTDENGDLLHFKKKPTWGSRLFDSAQPASEARKHRGQRRRYIRRRWRLGLLQKLFEEQMKQIDPDFFMRLKHSRTIAGDPIFNGSDFTKADYYDRFKTIYHLRAYLMETNEKADLRLIYLAMHNIVKHRGNFLREEDKSLSAKNAKVDDAVAIFYDALDDWCDVQGCEHPKREIEEISNVLANDDKQRKEIKEEIAAFVMVPFEEVACRKKFSNAVASAMLGLATDFKDIFGELECDDKKYLGKEEDLEELRAKSPDECRDLLEALYGVYSAYTLQSILYDPAHKADGKTISYYMISKYDKYGDDLKTLKELAKEFLPHCLSKDQTKEKGGKKKKKEFAESYVELFKGDEYSKKRPADKLKWYDPATALGYTAYDLGTLDYEGFKGFVKKSFEGTGATYDPRYQRMMAEFDNQKFLRRLKTSDNGSIYYQLHLEEFAAIIDNQARFYPFLKEEKEKLLSLVSFRIPYYVGPLTSLNAAKDACGNNRFQWSIRKPGMERSVVTPWNWENVIDKNASAEQFIKRMTNDCTYLLGEDVLPKNSLLYEEFCLRNELNGLKFSEDGDRLYRLTPEQCNGIIDHFIHTKKVNITYREIENWLVENQYVYRSIKVVDGQNKGRLDSSLATYQFFKRVLDTREIARSQYGAVEEVILWSTIFEDRSILREKLQEKYGINGQGASNGVSLSTNQIAKICKKRFSGWGRLSEKLLVGLKTDAGDGRKWSIMDVLRQGDPRSGRTMVFMEVLHNTALAFDSLIDKNNSKYYSAVTTVDVNDFPGSPAIRRSLVQALQITEEISAIAGHAPANIYIEVTRKEEEDAKGKQKPSFYKWVSNALGQFKKEDPAVWERLQLIGSKGRYTERLKLYFIQRGKCMYSGKEIDIDRLTDDTLYEVDHIIPRFYAPDDSLENKALVLRDENQRKKNDLLLDPRIIDRMEDIWLNLYKCGLIGEKKYSNLRRREIKPGAMRGFAARQLVETSQMVKQIQVLLKVRYPDSNILPVRANVTSELRKATKLLKCRKANELHHAHDAYFACRVGSFISHRHSMFYENPIAYAKMTQKLMRRQIAETGEVRTLLGSPSFIVNSFMEPWINKTTGEVLWDSDAEIARLNKVLDYRQCFISKKAYSDDNGQYWGAKPVSKVNDSVIPLKLKLDPHVYGGYTGKNPAHFFIYAGKNKTGDLVLKLAQVPIYIQARLEANSNALEVYAKGLAVENKLTFVSVVVARLLKNQLVVCENSRLWVTAEEEMKDASPLAFNGTELTDIANFLDDEEMNEELSTKVFDYICARLEAADCPLIEEKLSLREKRAKFENLELAEQKKLIEGILLVCKGGKASKYVDLSSIGGPKQAGRLRPARSSVPDNFYIIDQSVTGMFERKTRVGL